MAGETRTCDIVVGMYLCGNRATHRIAQDFGWRYVCSWHERSALSPYGVTEPLSVAPTPQPSTTGGRE